MNEGLRHLVIALEDQLLPCRPWHWYAEVLEFDSAGGGGVQGNTVWRWNLVSCSDRHCGRVGRFVANIFVDISSQFVRKEC